MYVCVCVCVCVSVSVFLCLCVCLWQICVSILCETLHGPCIAHVCKCVCASICPHVYASIMHCLVLSLGPNLQTDLDVFLSTEMRPSFATAPSKAPVKYWPSNMPNGGGSIILLLRQLCAGIDCDEASSYCYYIGFC